jgi:4a-hydroxytetrahydrobiopterin dehydratase
MDKKIIMRWWSVPPDEVPAGHQERIDWLFDWWALIDTWIGANRSRVGAMAKLLEAEAVATALSGLDGWSGGTDAIARTAKLATFPDAIAVVDRVAVVAEEMDHHPDIDIRWRTLTFRCATHSAGGVTELDIELARRIDQIVLSQG